MTMRPEAYKDTSVPVERSQAEIRRLLQKYGCSHISSAEDLTSGQVLVRFAHVIEGTDQSCVVRFAVKIPPVQPPRSGGYRGGRYMPAERLLREAKERAERQAWRALFYAVKSRMETILFGMETFEEAFLAHVEIVSTEGQKITFGQWALPRMASGRLALKAREE